MSIDIDHLSLEELYDLNGQVVDRIKLLEAMKDHTAMMALPLGAQVSFDSKHGRQIGTLVKRHRRTVVVLTDDGRQWKVPPGLLSPVRDIEEPQTPAVNKKRLS